MTKDEARLSVMGAISEHWNEIEEAYNRQDWKTVNNMLDKYRHENKAE